MAALAGEITAGLVLFLDTKKLISRAKIVTVPQRVYEPHWFVVFQVDGNDAMLSALTTIRRWERLEILPEWRDGGTHWASWKTEPMYLNDGASFYVASKSVIAEASEIDKSHSTKHLTPEGLIAVWQEVRKQKSRRINGRDLF